MSIVKKLDVALDANLPEMLDYSKVIVRDKNTIAGTTAGNPNSDISRTNIQDESLVKVIFIAECPEGVIDAYGVVDGGAHPIVSGDTMVYLPNVKYIVNKSDFSASFCAGTQAYFGFYSTYEHVLANGTVKFKIWFVRDV